MGVDLKLLPVECDAGDWGYAHSMLELGRNYTTHARIEVMGPREREGFALHSYAGRVPDGSFEGESCYGEVKQTPYGSPLTYLPSDKLIAALRHIDASPRDLAAANWLESLPEIKSVALYWH